MGKDIEETRSQIATSESSIDRSYVDAMDRLRNVHSNAELAQLVREHQLDAILTNVDMRDAAETLAKAVNDTYAETAKAAAAQLSSMLEHAIAWDTPSNHWATHRMSTNTLRLVRDIETDQRDAIRTALTQTTEVGMNPNAAARFIRGSIGLTSSQVDTVANYRQALVDGSARALDFELRDERADGAIESGRSLTDTQIDSMVGRYQNNLVAYRARVIARTEAMRAVHQGDADLWKFAVASGEIETKSIVRTWRTAHDKRVRPSHRAMDKQQRGHDEAFETGDGVQIMYPGDPDAPPEESVQCRCTVVTRIRR